MSDKSFHGFPSEEGSRIIVAISSSLSLLATSALFLYVIALVVITHFQPQRCTNKRDTQLSSNVTPLSPADHKSFKNYSYPNRAQPGQPYHSGKEDGPNPLPSVSSPVRNWAKQRLSFIKTPFGIMFMNLVWADFIQALGFGMNYFWVSRSNLTCDSIDCQTTCTVQGVLIQLGDLASAFSNLMIAIQTFVILTFSWHLPTWITWFSISLIWVPVFVLSFLAPTVMGNWDGPKPFYSWAGDWCWINEEYAPLRLFLHYLWIFIAAFASIALYGHLFLRLQIHFKNSKSVTRSRHHHQLPPGSPYHQCIHGYQRSKAGTQRIFSKVKNWALQKPNNWCPNCNASVTSPGSANRNNPAHDTFVTEEGLEGTVVPLQVDQLRKKLERKARAMLMYPIAFIFLTLPLSTFRLAALAGHEWGVTAASICGSIYCLSGFIDVLLFGTTRSIISVPMFSFKSQQRGFPQGATAIMGANGIGMSHSGLGSRSVGFRVEVIQETVIDLDEPNEDDLKELKSSNHHHDHHRRMSELNNVLPAESNKVDDEKIYEGSSSPGLDSIDSPTINGSTTQILPKSDLGNGDSETKVSSFLNMDSTMKSTSTISSDYQSQPPKPRTRFVSGTNHSPGSSSNHSTRQIFHREPTSTHSTPHPQLHHNQSQTFRSHQPDFTDPIPWQKLDR